MLEIVPMTLREANAFVEQDHRHHRPVTGHKFSIGCTDGERIVGVAIVGRPVSRYLDDGWTLEVNRLCTDGTRKRLLTDKCQEAHRMALSALRPVSQEQVEKVWPGCPYCKEDGEGYVKKFGAYSIQNGELATGHCKPQKIKFCPHCSRPLTDEAVEMVMERMDELQNEIG